MSTTRRRGRAAGDNAGDDEAQGAAGEIQHSPVRIAPPIPQQVQNVPIANQGARQDPNPPLPPEVNPGNLNMPNEIMRMLAVQQTAIADMLRTSNNALLAAIQGLPQALIHAQMPPPPVAPRANNANNGIPANANAAVARSHHLKTSDIRIPTYSGAYENKTPYDYLLELEKYQAIVGYSEAEIITNVIPLSLTGDAYQWYRYEPEFINLVDFRTRLRKEFQALDYKADLKREMTNRYQGTNEPLSSFIRIIVDYYERIGDQMEEEEIVNQIKRLMHPEYRKALIGMPMQTMDELKQAAPLATELIKSYRSYKLPPVSGSLEPSLAWKPNNQEPAKVGSNSINFATDTQPKYSASPPKLLMAAIDPFAHYHLQTKPVIRIENPARSRSSSPNTERRCYICDKQGHLANICPKKMQREVSCLSEFSEDD